MSETAFISSIFPPGTPVWYNFRDTSEETDQPTRIKVYEGVIRSVSSRSKKSTFFDIIRYDHGACKNNGRDVYIDEVEENSIAYGSRCPVHIKAVDTNSSAHSDAEGEIISPNFITSRTGVVDVKYTVRLFMDDGSFEIEQNVTPDRVQYKFGLDVLQSKLQMETSSKNNMIGIRTSLLGIPSIKSKTQNSHRGVKSKIKFIRSSLRRNTQGNAMERFEANNTCKSDKCVRHAQDGCDGYCFAHCYFALRNSAQNETEQPLS